MTSEFARLSAPALIALAAAIDSGQIVPPYNPVSLLRYVPNSDVMPVAAELGELYVYGMQPRHVALMLRLLGEERHERSRAEDLAELVWSGPEVTGSATRDTAVVIRDLFASAKRSVLVACFAIYQGRELFKTLANRMEEIPELRVRIFLNVPRPGLIEVSEGQILRQFVETFRTSHWPGQRLPELFYDPRSLLEDSSKRASLHAKCVVVDEERAFITSANFTEAAQVRNLEAGVLLSIPSIAKALCSQFENLVSRGILKPLLWKMDQAGR
jgi:phosphatidylserine/phosphatidylglycerophosphate/cardiolipin synthase-like enzyme